MTSNFSPTHLCLFCGNSNSQTDELCRNCGLELARAVRAHVPPRPDEKANKPNLNALVTSTKLGKLKLAAIISGALTLQTLAIGSTTNLGMSVFGYLQESVIVTNALSGSDTSLSGDKSLGHLIDTKTLTQVTYAEAFDYLVISDNEHVSILDVATGKEILSTHQEMWTHQKSVISDNDNFGANDNLGDKVNGAVRDSDKVVGADQKKDNDTRTSNDKEDSNDNGHGNDKGHSQHRAVTFKLSGDNLYVTDGHSLFVTNLADDGHAMTNSDNHTAGNDSDNDNDATDNDDTGTEDILSFDHLGTDKLLSNTGDTLRNEKWMQVDIDVMPDESVTLDIIQGMTIATIGDVQYELTSTVAKQILAPFTNGTLLGVTNGQSFWLQDSDKLIVTDEVDKVLSETKLHTDGFDLQNIIFVTADNIFGLWTSGTKTYLLIFDVKTGAQKSGIENTQKTVLQTTHFFAGETLIFGDAAVNLRAGAITALPGAALGVTEKEVFILHETQIGLFDLKKKKFVKHYPLVSDAVEFVAETSTRFISIAAKNKTENQIVITPKGNK